MSPKRLLILLLPLATAATATSSHSHEGPTDQAAPAPHQFTGQRGQRGPISIAEMETRTAERFASLDADKNGVLELVEFEPSRRGGGAAMRAMGFSPGGDTGVSERLFQRLDVDGSGEISEAELANMQAVRHDMMKALVFERLDTNADGKLTPDEFAPQLARLKELDVDGDGLVTQEERPRGRRSRPADTAATEGS